MKFTSDRQRRAVFANMFSNGSEKFMLYAYRGGKHSGPELVGSAEEVMNKAKAITDKKDADEVVVTDQGDSAVFHWDVKKGILFPRKGVDFSKKSTEEKADLVKENIGEKLQKEFAGRLPDSFVSGVDWYGIADPSLSLAENRKKVEKDFELFLDSKFSERDDELWEKVMATREKQCVKAGPLEIMDIAGRFNTNPMWREQVVRDLKIYPMHDAIAMWIDSADSLDDKEYGKVKGVANKFIADVEGGKFEKAGIKHKSKSKHAMDKTEREEARMEDSSKGTDPDWDAPDGTVFDDNEYSRKSMNEFIKEHREEIDNATKSQYKNDEERRLWILNDEGLYNWARSEGVRI